MSEGQGPYSDKSGFPLKDAVAASEKNNILEAEKTTGAFEKVIEKIDQSRKQYGIHGISIEWSIKEELIKAHNTDVAMLTALHETYRAAYRDKCDREKEIKDKNEKIDATRAEDLARITSLESTVDLLENVITYYERKVNRV